MDSPSGPETFFYREEAFAHRAMGAGFLESVYQECLAIELVRRGIPFEAQKPLRIVYAGQILRQTYVADFVCYDRILVELKALRALAPEHRARVINDLRATGLQLGLLANFGASPRLEVERFALSPSASSAFSADPT
jgi:GxxExxY protein